MTQTTIVYNYKFQTQKEGGCEFYDFLYTERLNPLIFCIHSMIFCIHFTKKNN